MNEQDWLRRVRQADRAWRTSRAKRLEAIRAAHNEGLGYGTIAKTLGVTRSYIQKVCNDGSGGVKEAAEHPTPTPSSSSPNAIPETKTHPPFCKHGVRWGRCCKKA